VTGGKPGGIAVPAFLLMKGHGTQVWKPATTIFHARRRAWARLTRRQTPHARARALLVTDPGIELPDSTGNGEEPFPIPTWSPI
jgi:hypothetical protein